MSLDLVPTGSDVPDDINVIIEIPMNAEPVKYEVDKRTGAIFVDRVLTTPIGMLAMTDEAGEDTKVIAVPIDKVFPAYSAVKGVSGLPELTLERIVHFFRFEAVPAPERPRF